MNNRIKDKILENSVSLENFGLNDLVWKKEDAKNLITSLMNDAIGILGGDVYKIYSDKVEPLYDNWSCEPNDSETRTEYFLRSKQKALEYITNYPNHSNDNVKFSLVFTDEINQNLHIPIELLITELGPLIQTHVLTAEKIAKSIPFEQGIKLAYRMLYNVQDSKDIQNDAISLLYAIRKVYPFEWNSSWKFDALLGNACDYIGRDEERYEAYKRATEKVNPIPPSLLVLLAKCYSPFNTSQLSQKEAENYLKQALKIEKSIEGVSLLRDIYKEKQDLEQELYLNEILSELETQNIHIHDIEPEFLKKIKLDFNS